MYGFSKGRKQFHSIPFMVFSKIQYLLWFYSKVFVFCFVCVLLFALYIIRLLVLSFEPDTYEVDYFESSKKEYWGYLYIKYRILSI